MKALSTAAWPESTLDRLPPLPGFIESSFSPLIAEVAERCLRQAYGAAPAPAGQAERTAIVIASALGDLASAIRVAAAVDRGERIGPLMFFQSVPNAVAGFVATRWGLRGPVVCVASAEAGRAVAELLFADGSADRALIVTTDDVEPDRATAVLVTAVETGEKS